MKYYNLFMGLGCCILGILFVVRGMKKGDKSEIGLGATLMILSSAFGQIQKLKSNDK